MELTQFLYDALTSPYGIIVETSDPSRLRQKLYPLRKGNQLFHQLSFILSPVNPSHLWIVKLGAPDYAPEI